MSTVFEHFTIAQLSDPHLSSLDNVAIRDLLSKRALGYLSWRLNRRAKYRPEILAALVQDLKSQQPNHTVITGDLTHVGLPHEFRQVREWLEALGSPTDVTVIPGNHDAYVMTDWSSTYVLWSSYMRSDCMEEFAGCERGIRFPSLRIRGSVAFIGLSTARPSAPFFATGRVGRLQLQVLERILVSTGKRSLFRVILLHHPPFPDTVAWRKRLTDHEWLRSVVERCGAELVLHGHAHRTSVREITIRGGVVPVIGVPSASAVSHEQSRRAQYHLYQLVRHQDSTWSVHLSMRGYSSQERRFVTLHPPMRL